MAESSMQIAESSRRENLSMREIAEDSRKIAEATAKDSEAMRTISFVTMIFLPATFAAVS